MQQGWYRTIWSTEFQYTPSSLGSELENTALGTVCLDTLPRALEIALELRRWEIFRSSRNVFPNTSLLAPVYGYNIYTLHCLCGIISICHQTLCQGGRGRSRRFRRCRCWWRCRGRPRSEHNIMLKNNSKIKDDLIKQNIMLKHQYFQHLFSRQPLGLHQCCLQSGRRGRTLMAKSTSSIKLVKFFAMETVP